MRFTRLALATPRRCDGYLDGGQQSAPSRSCQSENRAGARVTT
ncbi:hypothetical protein BURCENBC7_AP0681 [Burkholderia cenocepacia BC7]|nr:hypothetical protein BURCENBC7_AP0681 [Burkholderia cenocepacia BC7]